MGRRIRVAIGRTTVFATVVLAMSAALHAQSPPPVDGTVALEGTMKTFYRAANTLIVTTLDGVEHLYHFTKDLLVHGGRGAGVDALQGLQAGSTVVIHYTVEGSEASAQEIDRIGDDGLKVTEGVITRIDRGRKQITIRFDSGKTETLLLTARAAAATRTDLDDAGGRVERVVIYYSDESGRKVAHYFRKSSGS